MSEALQMIVVIADAVIAAYLALFFSLNLGFVGRSHGKIRRALIDEGLRSSTASASRGFVPKITLLVPAYNEEVTIAESIRSLLRLDYPSFEIVICNDGSKDRTVDVLRREFQFVRTDLEAVDKLPTSRVRGYYVCRAKLPPGLRRMVLIDKENGGKADALNAAINVSEGDFVTSMDADSLLEPDALWRAARPILESPRDTVAVGAQVGLTNGSLVHNGELSDLRVPRSWIGRFQVAEYMRSFSQGRMALSSFNSLLVLSGVFALLRRELVFAVGGFATEHMRTRVGLEYCGPRPQTVCEDMEVVVRLHRYLLDKKLPGRIVMLPFPLAWTEAPEVWRDLGKQRSRWYRGLLEVLWMHRAMLFRRRFKQIGWFALPYQWLFEAAAPLIEASGYLILLLSFVFLPISGWMVLAFAAFAILLNFLLSTLSVLVSVYSHRPTETRDAFGALFQYERSRSIGYLLFASLVANLGYRQYLVYWQLKGFVDFLRKKRSWDKFARKGFAAPGQAPVGRTA